MYNNKQISELDPIGKLTGKELLLVDNGEYTMKTTVDVLLGYIANEINKGTIPSDMFASTNIIEIPIGETIEIPSRVDGNFYLRSTDIIEAQIAAGLDTTIKVSPNMALKLEN